MGQNQTSALVLITPAVAAVAIRPYRVIILPMKKDSFIRRIYTGDNLPILRGMDSETADLIYLDPPFNSGKLFVGEKKF